MEMRTADRTFRRDLIAAVYAGLGPEEELTAGMILKNNGVMREGIQIRKKDTGVSRVVYLGSDVLKGVAQESALKVLELTAGKVVALHDSPMGFRHGPKSVTDDDTVIEAGSVVIGMMDEVFMNKLKNAAGGPVSVRIE